jgi:predicted Zn-dependent protease
MAVARARRLSGRRKRWAVVFVSLLIALAVAAVAAPRWWVHDSKKSPQRLDLLYAAWNEFNAQRYDQASAILDRRAAAVEPSALDWMLRARIAESQGRLVQALEHLKHIHDSDPVSSQARLKAGQIELARHNAAGAEAALQRSLALNPSQIQSYRELAYLYAAQRRREECDAQFRSLARLIPFDDVLTFAWCQNYLRICNVQEVIDVLRPFVAFDPHDRWSRLALATDLRLTHQLDQAEAALGPLLDSDPDVRALRAEIAIDKGEIDVAEALVRDGPSDHARLNAIRGRLALNANDSTRAAGYFRAALAEDPDDHDVIQGLGLALRLTGDPQAREFLDKTVRYENFKRALHGSIDTIHSDPRLFYKLGEHCESLHRMAEARAWYELAARRDPLDPQVQQALSRLDQAK